MSKGGGKYIEFNGKSQKIIEWSKEYGIDSSRIVWRMKKGWSIKDVLTKPVRRMPKRLPQSIRKQKLSMKIRRKNKGNKAV